MSSTRLDELLGFNYPITIRRLEEEMGGGYKAYIPFLGKDAFVGDGETIDEALNDLEDTKKLLFQEYLDEGIEIPKPPREETYSGRFVIRLPKYLHAQLVQDAAENDVSLNSYCTSLLSRNQISESYDRSLREVIYSLQRICLAIRQNIEFVSFSDPFYKGSTKYFKGDQGYGPAA